MNSLFEHCPELSLLLMGELPKPLCPLSKEEELLPSLELDGIHQLILYGLGQGRNFPSLRIWLEADSNRRLILLEDDLQAVMRFAPYSDEILNHDQVFLQFDEVSLDQFPSDRVEVAYLPYLKERGATMRLKLLRNFSSQHALFSDVLHSHKIVANLLANFPRIDDAAYVNQCKDALKGVPVIICGAGPSLTKTAPHLKKLEHNALIMAGGSALAALNLLDIEPHLAIALDPNYEEFERFLPITSFQTPLFYSNRLHPKVFNATNGPLGYLRSDTGGLFESWMEEKLGLNETPIGPELGDEAFSVTTLAIALAVHLGCNPIIFAGVDLAYTDGERYSKGLKSEEQTSRFMGDLTLNRNDIYGNPTQTQLKWIMESECISNYSKSHPSYTFYNATEGGLGFPSIPNKSLTEINLSKTYDLRGRLHHLLQTHPFSKHVSSTLTSQLQELDKSISRSIKLLKETKSLPLLELELREELAYDALLQYLEPVIETMMQNVKPDPKAKWDHILDVLTSCKTALRMS